MTAAAPKFGPPTLVENFYAEWTADHHDAQTIGADPLPADLTAEGEYVGFAVVSRSRPRTVYALAIGHAEGGAFLVDMVWGPCDLETCAKILRNRLESGEPRRSSEARARRCAQALPACSPSWGGASEHHHRAHDQDRQRAR